MIVSELIKELESVAQDAEVICVVYTSDSYESGYVERIDPNVKYNSVTKRKLDDGETVVELTTSTGR